MGGKSQEITVGYKYYVGMHLAWCRGPIDNITEIRVGDRVAWQGETSGGTISIDEEELFGGEDREGGVSGDVDIEMGGEAQTANSYLVSQLGAAIPAFRGIVAAVLKRPYLGNIPRFKNWAATGRRTPNGWSGAGSGLIGNDANPAHILYELITSKDWGMGYSESRVDVDAFNAARSTLASEGFGLSFLWTDENLDIEGFIQSVLQHIDASLYEDPTTGLWSLKLARDDYTVGNLQTLDNTNIIEVLDYKVPGWGELVNEMTVTYIDGEDDEPTWKERSVTIQNLAALQIQGGQVINRTHRYTGITKGALANRVCSRDLRQLSAPLAQMKLRLTSDQDAIRPGDVYLFSWPEYGITSMVIRIAKVNYGTLTDRAITVNAVQDVFSLVDSEFADPTPTDWIDPRSTPAPAPFRLLTEATYYQVAREVADSDAVLDGIDESSGFLVVNAVRPSSDAFNFLVMENVGGVYERIGPPGNFAPTTTITDDITPQQTVLPIDNSTATEDLDLVEAGTWAYLDGEIVEVTDIDIGAGTLTVNRGVIDTVPNAHSSGARIFFGQNFEATPTTEFVDSETANVRVLPSTSLGRLDVASAPTDNITFDSRFIRPYPPGQIRVNGEDWPEEVSGVPTLNWAHRDRTLQTAELIDQDAGPIGPEAGTTYNVRIRDGETGTSRRLVTGLTGDEYIYDEAKELNDGAALGHITWEIDALRDGYTNWQQQRREEIRLAGYGRHYGNDYGGLA
ncbi:MAG: phage tail protein [Gammaproteobacteria bacterium]